VTATAPLTVVYLSYGPRRLVQATAFSVLTFLHSAATLERPWKLAIYTDQPDVFRGYGIGGEFVPLDGIRDEYAAYRYRSKLLTIEHAARANEGDVVFVDGDTYFLRSPAEVFAAIGPRRTVMHTQEWPLESDIRPELTQLIRSGSFESSALQAAREQPSLAVWNSGVVGVAEENKRLIPAVISVTDELFHRSDYHGVEQLAWAIVLGQVGEIVPADDIVYHYWFAQEELTHRTVAFLRRNGRRPLPELAARAYALRPTATERWKPPLAIRARVAARSAKRRLRTAAA
jgi:hypothetical protein